MNIGKIINKNHGKQIIYFILILLVIGFLIWLYYYLSKQNKEHFISNQPGYKWSVSKSKDTNKLLLADISNLTPSRHVPSLFSKNNLNGITELTQVSGDINTNITIDEQTVKLNLTGEVININTPTDNQEYLSFLAPNNPDDVQDYKFFETPNIGDGFTIAMWIKFPGLRNLAEGQSESLFEIYNPNLQNTPTFIISRRANNYSSLASANNAINYGFLGTFISRSKQKIINDKWYHFAITVKYTENTTRNNTNVYIYNTNLYIDGIIDDSSNPILQEKHKLVINNNTQINIGKNSIAQIIKRKGPRAEDVISRDPTVIYSKFGFTDLQIYPFVLDTQSVKDLILKSRFSQTEFLPGQTKTMLGNLIKYSITSGELKRPLPETPGRNVIQLQSPSKISGFKFVSRAGTEKYRLFIADSIQQLLNPRTRIEIKITEAETLGGFSMSADPGKSLYNIKTDFEKEDGTPRYTGSVLAIEMPTGITTWPEITEYQIFGQLLNAPSMTEYEKYNNLIANITFAKSSAQSAQQDVIRVELTGGADQMVGKLVLTNFRATPGYSPQCRLKFRNSLDASKTSLFAINGPIRDQFINTPDTREWAIYLDRAIMANYLELTFTDSNNNPLNIAGAGLVLFGMTPSARDLTNYKLQAGQTTSDARMNIAGMNCPSTSEMLNKQVQAQLICEALEYKDKEKNKRLAYERDKLYLQKLKAQDEEIRDLETKISDLIKRKNELNTSNQGTNIEMLEKELKAATESRQKAEDFLKAKSEQRNALSLKFNLEPEFQNLLSSDTTPTPTS